jgi:hypothetical protein
MATEFFNVPLWRPRNPRYEVSGSTRRTAFRRHVIAWHTGRGALPFDTEILSPDALWLARALHAGLLRLYGTDGRTGLESATAAERACYASTLDRPRWAELYAPVFTTVDDASPTTRLNRLVSEWYWPTRLRDPLIQVRADFVDRRDVRSLT